MGAEFQSGLFLLLILTVVGGFSRMDSAPTG